jgi:hypothetical protein
MCVLAEFNEALEKFKMKLPEILNEKHKDAPPEVRNLLSALTAVSLQYLPVAMVQGGTAGVSAIRLAFELSKVLE